MPRRRCNGVPANHKPPKASFARPPRFSSRSRSTRTTRRPRSSASIAAAIPAMPAPAIATSAAWRSVSMTEYIPRGGKPRGGHMNTNSLSLRPVAVFLTACVVTMGAQAQGVTDAKKGQGGSDVQGAAGTQGAQGAASDLEKCDKPMGAMAVVEPQDYVMGALARYNLQSPVGLIRMMIQQSNCFIVVERGQGLQNMMQERAVAGGGFGGYGNTNEGKIIAASFADNYNNVVRVIRNDPTLQRDVGSLTQEAALGGSTKAGAAFNEGDVLYPKIAGVKILGSAADAGKAV